MGWGGALGRNCHTPCTSFVLSALDDGVRGGTSIAHSRLSTEMAPRVLSPKQWFTVTPSCRETPLPWPEVTPEQVPGRVMGGLFTKKPFPVSLPFYQSQPSTSPALLRNLELGCPSC